MKLTIATVLGSSWDVGAGFAFYFAKESGVRRVSRCLGRHPVEGPTAVCAVPNIDARVERSMFASVDRQRLSGIAAGTIAGFRRGGWAFTDWARKQMLEFQRPLLPKPQAAVGKFPTPPGCTWKDVEIRFQDSHTVTVIAGAKHERLMFTQMDWPMRRTDCLICSGSCCTHLHRATADDLSSPGARRENRKHREALNKTLRAFLRHRWRSHRLTDDKKGYRCTFKLVPDNSLEYARLAADREDE